jgi:hypothetical protein
MRFFLAINLHCCRIGTINYGEINLSDCLPVHHSVNHAFLSLATEMEDTSGITDSIILTNTIRLTDLLMGSDNHGMLCIGYWRTNQPKETD